MLVRYAPEFLYVCRKIILVQYVHEFLKGPFKVIPEKIKYACSVCS